MKKLFLFLALTIVLSSCTAPASQPESTSGAGLTKIVVGATEVPHSELLNLVKDDLEAQGIELEITVFDGYELINPSTSEKQLDANFFQHLPFLESYVKESGQDLVSIGAVHIEPLGIYSKKIDNLESLEDGATVTIPNDETNGARALLLLQASGLIKLKEGVTLTATIQDIAENSKNLEIYEQEAAMLPRSLDDAEVSVINGNFALEAGLNPLTDALKLEDSTSPYVNVIAVRGEDAERPELKALFEAITSQEVKDYILENYDGALIPVF
ncbi:MAG: MetQ/NlpA family ABC transporter substrate-binding protein [Clostridiales bacterium]|jgi:D-methionine transport system substrate-binding protein|nr:MetQ/NlpA family ABC transporter substrate-binding protein [Clostridiales bacterium]